MKIYNRQTTHCQGIAQIWIVGGVAVLALLVAWVAFNRSGEDLVLTTADEAEEAAVEIETTAESAADETEEEATELAAETQIAAARAEAQAELAAIQTELEAEATYADVRDDLDALEADLAAAYEGTSAELQQDYQAFQQGIDALRTDIRAGTAAALESLAELSLQLETEVQTTE